MKKLFQCFHKTNHLKKSIEEIQAIKLEEIKEQQKKLLELVSQENFQDQLVKTINSDIHTVIDKQSIFIKKRLEAKLESDLKNMEFTLISGITQSISGNIEKKLKEKIDESLENHNKEIQKLNKEVLENYKIQLNNIFIDIKQQFESLAESQISQLKQLTPMTSTSTYTDPSFTVSDFEEDETVIQPSLSNNIQPSVSNNPHTTTPLVEDPPDLLEVLGEIPLKTNSVTQERYIKQYSNDDTVFWGIGLENETYLQGNSIELNGDTIVKSIGRERYSVDYTKNYHFDKVKIILKDIYEKNKDYFIARMINGHCFAKMDRNNEHITTYEKEPKPNSRFNGKTVLDEWFEFDNEIKLALDPVTKDKTNIFFDGDTIEFISENFYKTNSKDVVTELISRRDWFINRLNIFLEEKEIWPDLGKLKFVETHPGLNIFRTAPKKIVLFNNTTIHIHITLPTKIENSIIVDDNKFVEDHKRAMKMIQWFEPFFICTLGSPDIMETIYQKYNNNDKVHFSGGSMRATMSRYIGIGTYDFKTMPEQKILQKPLEETRPTTCLWWRDLVEANLLYKLPEKEIGYDFNFKKHYQSGLEFRILDGIPMDILKDVLDVILLLCEHSYSIDVPNASSCNVWNLMVYNSMAYGYKAIINKREALEVCRRLRIGIVMEESMTLEEFYFRVLESMLELYMDIEQTKVLQFMTKKFNKINRWANFNKLQWDEHVNSLNSIN